MTGDATPERTDAGHVHAAYEDALAIGTGALVASLGLVLYAKAGLLTGGIAGRALLISYAMPVHFWLSCLTLNLPFVWLGWHRWGPGFVIRTGGAIAITCGLVEGGLSWIDVTAIAPVYAAIVGRVLIGIGLLILFRHEASLGGISILALHVQDRYRIWAGYVQMVLDAVILVMAPAIVSGRNLSLSILGTLVLNGLLAVHRRSERYVGVTRGLARCRRRRRAR